MSRIRHDAVAKQLGKIQAQSKRQRLKYLRNPGMGQLPEGQMAGGGQNHCRQAVGMNLKKGRSMWQHKL